MSFARVCSSCTWAGTFLMGERNGIPSGRSALASLTSSTSALVARRPERPYRLRALIVHTGDSPYRGHYLCYAKDSTGSWRSYNDTIVTDLPDGLPTGCETSAYIFFYVRATLSEPSRTAPGIGVSGHASAPVVHACPESNLTPPAKRVAGGCDVALTMPAVPPLPTPSQP